MQVSISAVEIYFDDCFDLLNNKVKIPIAGFGGGVKSAFTKSTDRYAKKEEFGGKGMTFVPVSNQQEFLNVM